MTTAIVVTSSSQDGGGYSEPVNEDKLAAEIRNAAYMVRHYRRPFNRLRREQAVQRLGLAVREAFNKTDNFEAQLRAILTSLCPQEQLPYF